MDPDDPPIVIRPDAYTSFGAPEGSTFCFITAPLWAERFVVECGDRYGGYVMETWHDDEDLARLLTRLPEHAHVFVVAPGRLISSPRQEELGARKVICMPCGSTPVSPEALARFLVTFEETDPHDQERRASGFFDALEEADYVDIVDERYGTTATLEYARRECIWNQQAGPVEWGEQQIAPAGELSVLPADVMSFDASRRLPLDGELALRGWPIVHRGSTPYDCADQNRLFHMLEPLRDHPVMIAIEDGLIIDHKPTAPEVFSAAGALEELFESDDRYRLVWEVGFGINTKFEIVPGNLGMNEVYGGRDGVVHIGIGLTPFTTYAPIVICPGASVWTDAGAFLLGGRPTQTRRIVRRKSPTCGCQEY